MKILFLDFDGPIIPGRSFFHSSAPSIMAMDKYTVGLLTKLCILTATKIVVSSQKRISPPRFMKFCNDHDFPVALLHDDWRVPILPSGNRSEEIHQWLNCHPEVTTYVALDDEVLDNDIINVRVHFTWGLTIENLCCLYYALGDVETSDAIQNICLDKVKHLEKYPDPLYGNFVTAGYEHIQTWKKMYQDQMERLKCLKSS
jgi:hypothetical protein